MEPADDCARLVIPNDLAALRPMSQWLAGELERLEATPRQAFNFDLCANEAVANVIAYGYPEGGRHVIELKVWRDADRIQLEIEDDGMPYNPLARAPHTQPASLEDARIGGLGVELIRKLMDECHYVLTPAHRNLLRLVVHRPATITAG